MSDPRNMDKSLLVYINKIDLYFSSLFSTKDKESAITINVGKTKNEIEQYFSTFLGLESFILSKKSKVVACSAKTGDNLDEGLKWADQIGLK